MSISPVLLLLLGSCIAAWQNNDKSEMYRDHRFYGRLYPAELINDHAYTGTRLARYQRQKRAFSPFQQAWKAILKTTIGYRRMPVLGSERKFFAKVGTNEQAKKDFLSLEPKDVVQTGYGLKGHVSNEIIELHTRAPDGSKIPQAILYVVDGEDAKIAYGVQSSSKTTREIYYFEKLEDIKTLRLGFFPWR